MAKRPIKSVKRHNSKKSMTNYIAAAILFVIVAFIVGIIIAYTNVTADRHETDKETLCRVDGEFDTNIVLIDITDSYKPLQLKNMAQKIDDMTMNLPKFSQVQLFFLKDKTEASLTPELLACNPGTGEGVSELYGNPELMKRRWEEKFKAPLNKLVNLAFDESASGEYGRSPIMEMIQSINSSSLSNAKGKKTLIIYSDMIQNSPNFSFLKNRKVRISKRADQLFKSMYFDRVKTDLTNIHVEINYTYREGMTIFQTDKYFEFWKAYFEKNNAASVTFSRIEG